MLNETKIKGTNFSYCGVNFEYNSSSLLFTPIKEISFSGEYTISYYPTACGDPEIRDLSISSASHDYSYETNCEKNNTEKNIEDVKKLMEVLTAYENPTKSKEIG